MGIVEAFLILVGVTLIICSFFITEKLSSKDLKKISDLSEKEIKVIMEKRLAEAESKIDDMVEKSVDLSLNKINRELNQETDDKIMAIGDYSQNVTEELTKTHNEVTFLYSMLTDKHDELTKAANEAGKLITEIEDLKNSLTDSVISAAQAVNESVEPQKEEAEAEILSQELSKVMKKPVVTNNTGSNHNEEIIRLHEGGMETVDIAKELGLGYGEVQLVLDLYK